MSERKSDQSIELAGVNQWEMLVKHSFDIISVLDENGVIQYESPSVERVLGYHPHARIGKSVFEFIHADDRDTVISTFGEFVAAPDEVSAQADFRYRHSDNSWVWLEAVSTNRMDSAVGGFVVNSRDVTERKRQAANLDAERLKFQFLTDHLPDVVYRANPKTFEPTYINTNVETIYGYSAEDWLSDPTRWEQSIDPRDRKRVLAEFSKAKERYVDGVLEYRVQTKAGETKWVQDRFGWEHGPDGTVSALVGITSDITDLRSQLKELRRTKRAIDASPTAVYITDIDGRIDYVNEGFEQITGYTRAEVLGKSAKLLNSGHMPDDYFTRLWETLLAGADWEEEVTNQRKSGATYVAMQTISPIFDCEGATEGFVAIQVDITNQKQREQHLQVVDRLLRHDLKNDLTVIRGLAEMISREGDGDIRTYAQQIVDRSDHFLTSTETSREIIKVLTDDIEPHQIDLVSLAGSTLDELRTQYPHAKITFDAPEILVVAGARQLAEIIDELVENAIVHTDTDSPSVRVLLVENDGMVELVVSDDGPGVPQIEFEELSVVKNFNHVTHGQGLGLWLVYWLVQRLDGTLTFESTDPRGTVVTVRLQL